MTTPQLNGAMNNAITAAISGTLPQTANNCNGVPLFDQSVPSYYDSYFQQGIVDKINELITALRR